MSAINSEPIKSNKLEFMIQEMETLMIEMYERMMKVLQLQQDNFTLEFRSVLTRIIEEFKRLK